MRDGFARRLGQTAVSASRRCAVVAETMTRTCATTNSTDLCALHGSVFISTRGSVIVSAEGETQALQIAAEQEVDLLLSDDTAARLAAQQLDIPVHGSLGILLRAVRRRQLSTTQVVEILHVLPQRSTLHVKPSLLQSIIDEVASVD